MESAPTLNRRITLMTRDDHTYFESLFAAYQQPILSYLYRLLGDAARAEELCQEVFVRAYRARRSLDQVENVRAWLYRIATNAARDQLRRRRLLAWLPLFDEDPALMVDSPEASSLETYAVEHALRQLSPDFRVPLVLYSCQELSTQEIANVLGISRDAVKQRLVRARLRFKELYQHE
jgi:RNA polymerase sigma-70 factor (ECF subfamily)